MSKAEIQHFVPQLLLRPHVRNPKGKGSEQVWCFDKSNDKMFSPNIKGILAESRFYEIKIDGSVFSLESSLGELESRVSPVLERLIKNRSLQATSEDDRAILAAFFAVQMVRTRAFREKIKSMNEGIADVLMKRGIDPVEVPNFKLPSDEEIKDLSLDILSEAPGKYGPYFIDKYWYLIEATEEDPFHLGDHPVVLDNDFVRGAPGGLGLASPGVAIYFPLCPTLCLCMVDQAAMDALFEGRQEAIRHYDEMHASRLVRRPTPEYFGILEEMRTTLDKILAMIEPFEKGTPTGYNPETVMRANSLQMIHATRWIVSSRPDLSLPKIMIADDENFRKGPAIVVE
jgi:hypothetical protein